jgi:hypothetical protein
MNIRAKVYGGASAVEESLLRAKTPKQGKPEGLHTLAVPRQARRLANGRAEDRHRLSNERARVTYKRRDREVELINLSGGGAMIAGAFKPKLWDRVDLHLGNHGTIECAVRWIRDGRVGLEFAHETRLDWPSDQVATVLRHVIERTFPHIEFPKGEEKPAHPVKEAPADENRAAPRHPLIWSGKLHHNYQSSSVRIRNISETGAMIETDASVGVGSEPLLELCDTVSISATVEWAVGDQVGLRFHSPFDMRLLAESRPAVVTSEWAPPPYLGSDKSGSGEDRWNRLTLSQLRQELEGFLKH